MKAAVLTKWENINITEMSKPVLENDECLIKVEYAGICGSDLHIFKGHHPTARVPQILGHEIFGTIEKIKTSRKTDIQEGDRVVVYPLINCGKCQACLEGYFHVCENLNLLGIHCSGGFAEYVKVDINKVVKIDSDIPGELAVLAEPFAVGYHINERGELNKGDHVLIIGGGPIGLVTGIVASIKGAKVTFSEINPERKEFIKSFGFKVINGAQPMNIKNIMKETFFDIVFEVSGSQKGIELSINACKIRGKVVQVGFPQNPPHFDLLKLIFKELQVIGSRVYSFEHFKKAVSLLVEIYEKNIIELERLIYHVYMIDDLEEALQVMKESKNLGKILIKING